jgi:glycosyltransferase involved in cell wall biosynthesis
MKVSIIFLDYLRHDYTARVKAHNLANAGHDFSLVTIDRKGIAAALNEGIMLSRGHDAIVTMANDILMPAGWLANMVAAASAIPETGMCGIHTVEGLENPDPENRNGILIHRNYTAFGNVLIPATAISKVGAFNEEYDPYGMQDADYAHRLLKTGHINYYLHGLRAEHIGHDVGNGTEYRRMKDESLGTALAKWDRLVTKYDQEENYTINLPEWP